MARKSTKTPKSTAPEVEISDEPVVLKEPFPELEDAPGEEISVAQVLSESTQAELAAGAEALKKLAE